MDLYSILGQQLSTDEALPPETAPAAAALFSRAQPLGAEAPPPRPNPYREEVRPESVLAENVGPSSIGPSSLGPSHEEYTLALRLLAEAKLRAFLASAVERVRYISNASGVALALCEGPALSEGAAPDLPSDRTDAMVCHASGGPSAPEVGARMYIRSGITSESLRTRQTLRCDRASTDSRVNQESCKALGIESVLVMPVILNRNVVGMFQLFGARPSAFSERDATTLRASLPQVAAALQEAVDAGLPLGYIPWAEEAPVPAPAPQLDSTSEENGLEHDAAEEPAGSFRTRMDEPETISMKVPLAFPIDAYRKQETAEVASQDQVSDQANDTGKDAQEVPAFLARLADEARPAPTRTWSQWFRPQW